MSSHKPADEPLNVTVRIMGKEYSVTCPPDEHEALVKSADYLNERMTSIRRRGKALGTEKIAVMAALNIARELLELKGVEGVASASPEALQRLRQLSLDIDSTLSLD
ncbi:MAG: cell division protein ZapA [Pseudomonadota bacterium]|jgi:cell division protein ZapA